ncbi:MAG: GTP 3',8-cyclase MoaA [Phycisphaerales bacterium JB038]
MIDVPPRPFHYLRLSITTRCPMRCLYCRPEGVHDDPRHDGEPLSVGEIEALVRHLVERHGLRKVRLTGGDPTSCDELLDIIASLAAITGIETLAMTTNGLRLPHLAADLAAAGLHRINISLDSLAPDRFAQITGTSGLSHVLRGIEAAQAAGLGPVKINTVVMRGRNDDEVGDFVRFAADRAVETRFIELMPMGPLAAQWRDLYVPSERVRAAIEPLVERWEPASPGPDSARSFDLVLKGGGRARVGFISPMSCPFCDSCNRLRVASNGAYYPCLMDRPAGNLLPALRPQLDAAGLDALLAEGLAGKAPEHPSTGFVMMTHIGG